MKDPLTYFFSTQHLKEKGRLFKKLLYFFLLFQCIYWLFNYRLLFGENSVIADKEFDLGFIRGTAFFLYQRSHQWLCLWAIVLVLALSILSLIKIRFYFFCDFIAWIIILNLHNRVYSTLTAGDFLLNQLLFFNCFIAINDIEPSSPGSQIKIFLHNFGVIAVIAQVCLLYLASGITKLTDASWMNGEAVSIISQVDHFNLFHPVRFARGSIAGHLLNFTVVFYQLLFPVLICFRNIKKPLLIMGMIIHIYIAFVMGLLSFGLLMLIPYSLLWPKPVKSDI